MCIDCEGRQVMNEKGCKSTPSLLQPGHDLHELWPMKAYLVVID